MSSVKKQSPLFQAGVWVSFAFGPRKVFAQVIEDRGPLGVRGGRLYRVQPDDQRGEASAFEMPEDELAIADPPVRQSFEVLYQRQGTSNEWRATTRPGRVHRGLMVGLGESTSWVGEEIRQDLTSATVTVFLEIDPKHAAPDAVVPPQVTQEQPGLVRSMADEVLRSRHPRARIVPA